MIHFLPMGPSSRAAVRARWGSVLLLAGALALLFGGSMAALAGARRSSTAIDRMMSSHAPEDVFIAPADENGRIDPKAIGRLPEVVGTAYEAYLAMVPVGSDGRPQTDLAGDINPYLYQPASGDPDAIHRLRVIRGRPLDRSAPLEVVIDEELAEERSLSVGSTLVMAAYALEQGEAVFGNETSGDSTPEPAGPVLRLKVVGIARMPVDIHVRDNDHTTSFGGTKDIYLSPALLERYAGRLLVFGAPDPSSPLGVRLRHGLAGLDAFTAEVRALPGGDGIVIDVSDSDAAGSARTARRAVGVETAALDALAGLLAAAGLVLGGHALARSARSAGDDLAILRAIGLSSRQLLWVAAAPGVVAVAAGTVGSLAVALAGSAFTPIGLARRAEVALGVRVDLTVFGGGGLVLLAMGVITSVAVARPTVLAAGASTGGESPRTGRLVDRLASWGAPLPLTLGARFATSHRRRERVAPLRSAMLTSGVALLVLVGVATFTASLSRLSRHYEDQGVNWDLAIGNINLSDYTSEDFAQLAADPHIDGVAAVAAPEGRGSINHHDIALAGFDSYSGGVEPRMLSGRPAHALGEVVLGHRTAHRLGAKLGDRVQVGYAGTTTAARVVGTALLSPGISPSMQIGDGALVSVDQMLRLTSDKRVTFLLATVKPGMSIDRAVTALQPKWGKNVARPVFSSDVVNVRRVEGVPVMLALALGGAAVLLLAAALVLSVRQRRAEIGVLRALGLTPHQLAAAFTWQALWLYAGAAVLGLPLGVVAGRLAWRQVATGIGALNVPVVPIAQVAMVAAGGLVVVALLVVLPARSATRSPASLAIRAE